MYNKQEDEMPSIDVRVISLLAGIAAAITQLLKGVFLSETAKRWLPVGVMLFCTAAGAGLAFAYSRDIVAGIVEGIIAGLSSLGLYAAGKSVVPSVINTDGWINRQ
jgi:hypothetical protein